MAIHPDSLKNLKPGQSTGRKRTIRYSVGEVIEMVGNNDIKETMDMMKGKAKKGDVRAGAWILDKVTPAAPKQPPIEEELKLEGTPLEKIRQLHTQAPGVLNAAELEAVTKSILAEQEIINGGKLDLLLEEVALLKKHMGIE